MFSKQVFTKFSRSSSRTLSTNTKSTPRIPIGGPALILTTGFLFSKWLQKTTENLEKQNTDKKSKTENFNLLLKFKKFDQNNNGYLSVPDLFRCILNKSEDELSDDQIYSSVPEIKTLFPDEENNAEFCLSSYILLTSILISPKTKFRLAFDMIDLDESGKITASELQTLLKMFNSHQNTNTQNSSYLTKIFFKNGSKTFTYQEFERFSKEFVACVYKLEYKLLANKSPSINGVTRAHFANSIMDMSGFDQATKIERIKNNLKNPEEIVTFEDYVAFKVLMNNISKFKQLTEFHSKAKIDIDVKVMGKISKLATIDEEDVSNNMLDLIFSCYDSSYDDGVIDYKDFLRAFHDNVRYSYVYCGDSLV